MPRKYLQAQLGLVDSIHPSFTRPSSALASGACTLMAWQRSIAYRRMRTQSEIKLPSCSSNKIAKHSSDGQLTSNFTQHTCMNANTCGHHCVFFCSPNLSARVHLQGKNLDSGRELADVRLPLGFWRMSRIQLLKRNDQCTEICGDLSITSIA